MVQRTVILLACGPGATDEFETKEAEVAKPGGGGAQGNGGKVSVSVTRSVWSACVEAVLEYARVAFELLPRGAGVSVMAADRSSGGVARALNGWGPKDQTLAAVSAALEGLRPSPLCVDGPAAAAAAAQAILENLERCLAEEERAAERQGGPRRAAAGGCRVVFIAAPASLGCGPGGQDAGAVEEAVHRAARVVWSRAHEVAGGLDTRVQMVWVSGGGGEWPRAASARVEPLGVKAEVCRMVRSHLQLQSVRIIGIPMKDEKADKKEGEGGKSKAAR